MKYFELLKAAPKVLRKWRVAEQVIRTNREEKLLKIGFIGLKYSKEINRKEKEYKNFLLKKIM